MTSSLKGTATARSPSGVAMLTTLVPLSRWPAWVINGLTVTVGLLLVQASVWLMAGVHAAQVAIAMAVCASLADVVATPERIARRVFAAIVCSCAAAALLLVARPHTAIVLPCVVLVVLCAMLLQAWGPKAGTISFATNMSLVFAMSTPLSQGLTADYIGWSLIGAGGYWIWAIVTARHLQPTWRRLTLSSTLRDVAVLLRLIAAQTHSPSEPALQQKIVQQEAILADRMQAARDLIFGNADGPDAHLQTSVLLRLADLRDMAMAAKLDALLARQDHASEAERRIISDGLQRMALALEQLADHVRSGRLQQVELEAASMSRFLRELEKHASDDRNGLRRTIAETLKSQLAHVLAIQRMHTAAAQPSLPCQREDLRRYIAPDAWRLATLWAALRPGSSVLTYALRTAFAAGFAYAAARLLPWVAHPQWVLLSVIVVMQGSLAQTLIRRNARVLGTLLGCMVAAILTLSHSSFFLSLCFLIAGGVAHAYLGVRYAITAAAAAVMAVLQASLVAHGADFGILERLGDTVFGAVIGWAASYVVPTWERRHLAADLRQATEAIRLYMAEALKSDAGSMGQPRHARQRAYDAIRVVEVAGTRSLVEPSSVRIPNTELTLWLQAAYALMSHLSNARLSLTLYAKEFHGPSLSDALAQLTSRLDRQLQHQRVNGHETLTWRDRNALSTIPDLLPRLENSILQAETLIDASDRLCTMVSTR